MDAPPQRESAEDLKWYEGISRYQWLVLVIASLGWVFDAFEGQIFVASMEEAIPSLVPPETSEGTIARYNNIALGCFLIGGALGGIVFGALSDRIGRTRTMALTILFYSIFTCLSAFSQQWWHLAALRFLVAMGVGGEWAVATALLAEVFPKRARAHVGGLFHATSVLGSYLAVAAGLTIIGNPAIQEFANERGIPSLPWRLGFAVGVLPALLIIWIRMSLREPEDWKAARRRAASDAGQRMGVVSDLFSRTLRRRTLLGICLATVGLATFWGVHIYGKNVLLQAAETAHLTSAMDQMRNASADAATRTAVSSPGRDPAASGAPLLDPVSRKRWEMLGMFLVTSGGGVGLVCFGPLAARMGRRPAFFLFHLGGLISALCVFQFAWTVTAAIVLLPIFGFLTLGMHAGYAVYFPELYPTRLRGTGAGMCFNAGRLCAAPILFVNGYLQEDLGWSLNESASLLSVLFVAGIFFTWLAPETRGTELPQ